MIGRLHAAAHAMALGFRIEADDGPSGNLRHWRIAAVPEAVEHVFSKRSDEIAEHLAESGRDGYRARSVAARATRSIKRHTGVAGRLPGWHRELEAAGHAPERLGAELVPVPEFSSRLASDLTPGQLDQLVAEALDIDERFLLRHKTFTRTHLIAELAPRLYGHQPAELERALARVVESPELVPLIGTGCTREQVYTTRSILEAEQTIAEAAAALAERNGPLVPTEAADQAVAGKEQALGRRLSPGQRDLVDAVCGGQSALRLVVGVAGSGKTTALDAARAALKSSGYRVLGVSTSGQAARTLGTGANLEASTFASLLRRLDTGRTTLDANTVLIVDEAGMANDADLSRLLLATGRTATSVVLVGDDRQLPAVGPGGAFPALLRRHPSLVVTFDGNVRQHDVAERDALAHLRDGDLSIAIEWYCTNGRVSTNPGRMSTLVSMADAWAADVDAGHDTVMLAWRRDDVDALNRVGRHCWGNLGRLTGPEVTVAGGRVYAAGDLVVATAPNHQAGIVTSERLTVTRVREHVLYAVTADGRPVRISGAGLGTDYLDYYGYALTVHRAQGLTCDRTHVLAGGGGRELAYVAASRARQHTQFHMVAPDLAGAAELLAEQLSASADEPWITDTDARPGIEPEPSTAVIPPAFDLVSMSEQALDLRLGTLQRDLRDLRKGQGRWADTPEGAAVRTAAKTRDELDLGQRVIADPSSRRRDRRAASRALESLTATNASAMEACDRVLKRAVDSFDEEITNFRREMHRREHVQFLHYLDTYAADRPTPDRTPPVAPLPSL